MIFLRKSPFLIAAILLALAAPGAQEPPKDHLGKRVRQAKTKPRK